MSIDVQPPAPRDRADDSQDASDDSSLEALRQILLREQVAKMESVERDLDRLEHQIYDEGALVKMIAPILGEAIRLKIRDAREEMIEALYPIIGKVVQRAVLESVSELARSLDAQVKSSFDLRLTWWRFRARFSGASESQIRLRELLPFTVTDLLLIHRETGLLLIHLSSETSRASDTDLFSGMLTAIRDFSENTLGGDDDASLGEIGYGDQSILIETARHIYLAVIINGVAPPAFRAEMRDRIIEIEHSYAEELRSYHGDASPLMPVKDTLRSLMVDGAPKRLSPPQKRFLAGALGTLLLLLVGCGLFTHWAWKVARQTPPAPIIIIQPAATLTTAPSATAAPTATVTPRPAATASETLTPLEPTPAIGVSLGSVWMHLQPSPDSTRTGALLTPGEPVEILAVDGEWARVRKLTSGQSEITGWIPVRWLEVTTSIPVEIITPDSNP